jgi:hypothetical protein
MTTRPRAAIDVSPMYPCREHPHRPMSRLTGSRLRSRANRQMRGDPTHLIAADADIRPESANA